MKENNYANLDMADCQWSSTIPEDVTVHWVAVIDEKKGAVVKVYRSKDLAIELIKEQPFFC